VANSQILQIGNLRKIKEGLKDLLGEEGCEKIETGIKNECQGLYSLALNHYRFANGLSRHQWRQKVSRYYYAAYMGSRTIRLYVHGDYSIDVKDHSKIGQIPSKFPKQSEFSNKLDLLREDRNTCDYDHNARASELNLTTSEAYDLVTEFLVQAQGFLQERGLILRGKI